MTDDETNAPERWRTWTEVAGLFNGPDNPARKAYRNRITDDLVEPRFEDLPPQELAASRDRNRDMESETPDE